MKVHFILYDSAPESRDFLGKHQLDWRVPMGLRIATNVSSLTAQRNLRNTRRLLDKSLTRLSSGLSYKRAGDDAAGLAISEKLEQKLEV